MSLDRIALALAGLMFAASVGAIAVRPTTRMAETEPRIALESMIPRSFDAWSEEPGVVAQVVNPQTQAILDKLYSQVLTRTYTAPDGYRVMLSIAYGEDQRDNLRAHKPERCYPAQGFTLLRSEPLRLSTPHGDIAARRMQTHQGPRQEPVTYWYTVGNRTVEGNLEAKLQELRLGLSGMIPDGLVFRVSSIDADAARAARRQDEFIRQLLASLSPSERLRLAGLATVNPH